MKIRITALATTLACLSLFTAHAQMGGGGGGMGGPRGPQFGGSMAKLFGDNSAFSATLEVQVQAKDQPMTMPGKIAFADGKTRFEMNMTETKGGQMRPQDAAQMKAMGMGQIVSISIPGKKLNYKIFPDMQAYVESPIQNPDVTKPESDFKVETTELGKETVDGHPCVKNKAVVTDKEGQKHESIIWNATDLNKFPIKIESTEQGQKTIMLFKDVKLAKPAASLFEPPSDFKKYDSDMGLMQQEMMKRMGGGMGMPPRNQ
jgi:hypothetical protein